MSVNMKICYNNNNSCVVQEFDKIPMFMKTAPEEFDPREYPELGCIQAIIHDEDRSPEGKWVDALLLLIYCLYISSKWTLMLKQMCSSLDFDD